MNYVFVNGEYVKSQDAKISVFDRGFLFGDGLFETMKASLGKVEYLDAHLDRLFESAKFLKINIKYTKDEIKNAVCDLISKNKLNNNTRIRITLTRGDSAGDLTLENTYEPNIVITQREYHPPDKDGFKLIIASIRQNSNSPLAFHKTLNYLENLLAIDEATQKGADEAILLNTEGFVCECATSNIFFVQEGKVFTPSIENKLLAGIMRGVVLSSAKEAGFDVEERNVKKEEILKADEIFITNSLIGIMPVFEVDNVVVSQGQGILTQKIREYLKRSKNAYSNRR